MPPSYAEGPAMCEPVPGLPLPGPAVAVLGDSEADFALSVAVLVKPSLISFHPEPHDKLGALEFVAPF